MSLENPIENGPEEEMFDLDKLEAIKSDERFEQLLKGAEVCENAEKDYFEKKKDSTEDTQGLIELHESLNKIRDTFFMLMEEITKDHGMGPEEFGGFSPSQILHFDEIIEKAK